jgi:hypothetical protein
MLERLKTLGNIRLNEMNDFCMWGHEVWRHRGEVQWSEFCILLKFKCWASHMVMVLRGWTFDKWLIRSWGWNPYKWDNCPCKRAPRELIYMEHLTPCGGHSGKVQSMNQKIILQLPVPWSWTSQPLKLWPNYSLYGICFTPHPPPQFGFWDRNSLL